MMRFLCNGERQAVRRHRESLSAQRGHDVSDADALADWLQNHAQTWREERHARILALQRHEILRHKWIESEKARRDLGSDAALDWIQNHAAKWREWYETECELSET